MKPYLSATLAVATILCTAQVSARDKEHYENGRYGYDSRYDERDDERYDHRYDDRYLTRDGYYRQYPQARYVKAKVVRVERINAYGGDYGRYCGAYRQPYDRSGINGGAVVGAVIGGVIGNQASSNQNRTAATVAGAAIGGLIGQSIDRNNGGDYDRQFVQCRPDWSEYRQRDVNYRVTYRYKNRYYTTVMPYYPDKHIQIRVDAWPQPAPRVAYRY